MDRDMAAHLSLAELVGVVGFWLAEPPVLPFSWTDYAAALEAHVDRLQNQHH